MNSLSHRSYLALGVAFQGEELPIPAGATFSSSHAYIHASHHAPSLRPSPHVSQHEQISRWLAFVDAYLQIFFDRSKKLFRDFMDCCSIPFPTCEADLPPELSEDDEFILFAFKKSPDRRISETVHYIEAANLPIEDEDLTYLKRLEADWKRWHEFWKDFRSVPDLWDRALARRGIDLEFLTRITHLLRAFDSFSNRCPLTDEDLTVVGIQMNVNQAVGLFGAIDTWSFWYHLQMEAASNGEPVD